MGFDPEAVLRGIEGFGGTERRFELHGTVRGVRVYDDYAHHPTEVRAALATARSVAGGGRVIAVHQPHLYSRTQLMAGDFAEVYESLADHTIVLDVFGAREDPVPGVTGALVSERFADPARVDYLPDWQQAADRAGRARRRGRHHHDAELRRRVPDRAAGARGARTVKRPEGFGKGPASPKPEPKPQRPPKTTAVPAARPRTVTAKEPRIRASRADRPDAGARADLKRAARDRKRAERVELRRFTRRARTRRIIWLSVGGTACAPWSRLVLIAVYSPILALRTMRRRGHQPHSRSRGAGRRLRTARHTARAHRPDPAASRISRRSRSSAASSPRRCRPTLW